jgi:predicted glutamine amidotransferase
MCELFCLSSRHPARATFSLRHFAAHGAPDGRNVDGWGVAFHEGRDVRLYKEPEPAGGSPWLTFIERHSHPTQLLMSHIRRATCGGNSLANTQPFARELGGRMHLFAHNGGFDDIIARFARSEHRFRPVGETDSERAFCLLLERLAILWEAEVAPSPAARHDVVAAFAAEMRSLGIANFLYSDGELVFAHGHRRTQADGVVAPPGLWVRHRRRGDPPHAAVDPLPSAGIALHPQEAMDRPAADAQEMALFASVPVTKGHWSPLAEGEIAIVSSGELVRRQPRPF